MPPKKNKNNEGNDEDTFAASINKMNESMTLQYQNLMQAIQTNATQMSTLQASFNTFKEDIEQRVDKVEADSQENDATVKELEKQVKTLITDMANLKNKTKREAILGNYHQMKYNLKFYGILETVHWESNVDTEDTMRKFFRDVLDLNDADSIGIVNAHRLGQMSKEHPRTVIVRFSSIFHKEKVLGALKELKDYNENHPKNRIYVTEHLPERMKAQRKLLIPKMKEARYNKQKYKFVACKETGDYILLVGGKRIESGYKTDDEEEYE